MAKTPQHLLGGLNIAILVTDGFEQEELTGPRQALEESGVMTRLVSDKQGEVQGYHHKQKADSFEIDITFDKVNADEFDAVLIPGGAINAARIRHNAEAQRIVKHMNQQGKPIAVICHGPWLLVSAGLVEGRKLTSWPSLKEDIEHAGGHWVDAPAVVDGNWISSRKPEDIPAFNTCFKQVLGERTRNSVKDTADDMPSAAGMGD